MAIGLIAKKVGMTQIFDEEGRSWPVTVVEAGPCPVVQKKTKEPVSIIKYKNGKYGALLFFP